MKNEGPAHIWAFERIQNDILSGRYAPGENLTEVKLAEELGISRTPVREALRQLATEGLLVMEPNRGVFVRGIRAADVRDVYAIRATLEGMAVRWAVERMDDAGMDELLEKTGLMEFYLKRGGLEKLGGLDIQFHETVYKLSQSEILMRTLGALESFVQRARIISIRSPERATLAVNEHIAIAMAIKARDAEKASRLMEDHIRHAMTNIEKSLENGNLAAQSDP